MPQNSGRNEYNPIRLVTGASWLYPLKVRCSICKLKNRHLLTIQGIIYFTIHPRFWPLFKGRLLTIILLSLFIYAILFTFAFLPQVAFLYLFHGPGAWVNAAFLTLGEGSAIVAILFECFFVDETLVDVFDAVLIDGGCQDLVSNGRTLDTSAENSVKMLGTPIIKSVYSPFSLRQIVEFVLLLPLNFIPYVGVPFFLLLTGYRAGPLQHWRYWKLLDLTKKERNHEIEKRKLKYMWFGAVHLLLQLVPGLSMLFLVTSAAGSALWVVKLEQQRKFTPGATIQASDEYHDDPA